MTKLKGQKKIKINLALQGGGSHGAFTWGVLDRLLEETSIEFEGISGSSAGAMNGCILATGMIKSGHEKAREDLERFWRTISTQGSPFNPINTWTKFFDQFHLGWHPAVSWFDLFAQIVSPSEFNPLNYNPLRDIIRERVDFKTINTSKKIKVYVNATNVQTNKIKIFEREELCEEALLASACLPTLFQPVEYKGNYYWDGGYTGNPILEPLIYNCRSKDLVVIPINAINRRIVPNNPVTIIDRINEITFNSSLMREIRNIISMERFSQSTETVNPYMGIRLHSIQDDRFMENIGTRNKYNTDWTFLKSLKEMGRATANKWIKDNFHLLGKESTMDLESWRLETPSTKCLSLPNKSSKTALDNCEK